MNFLPLCTAIVWPTISGITVERRDQVLTTFFSLTRFIASIFSSRNVSTNGPFLSDLLITVFLAGTRGSGLGTRPAHRAPGPDLLGPPLDDELICVLATARL